MTPAPPAIPSGEAALASEFDDGSTSRARPLRRDAERNRQLILDVAGELFAEHGLEVGFDQIARRAGVGVGTVYRRFPDREDLVDALFAQRIEEMTGLARRANEMPDAWLALSWFLEQTVQRQGEDRGLKQVMTSGATGYHRLAMARDRLTPLVDALVARAQAEGGMRQDVVAFDLAALTSLLSSARTSAQPDLWRRYLGLVLDGLREDRGATSPLPVPAPDAQGISQLA